ncbi:hypothetical protein DAPK24_032330 [Pichia kluyveri]|uniref:Zn(2)-C6 fungal-type domain-containing protein n=1 Tax=Pichia kluyveri TaxID=36015 RepID=A0AAV5R620_PICKL|nr:hypothetical protein DAPK24_032330 [Pichia kluyveri]
MSKKKVIINEKSFVGLGKRSKSGCLTCRKRKKKCDEVHPICGLCKRRNSECIWRDVTINNKNQHFDFNSIVESQKLIKSQSKKEIIYENSSSIKKPQHSHKIKQVHQNSTSQSTELYNLTKDWNKFPHGLFSPKNYLNSPDFSRAVDGLMGNDSMFEGFIDNIVDHIQSPQFNPDFSLLDSSIQSSLTYAVDLINKSRRNSTQDIESKSKDNINQPPFSPLRYFMNFNEIENNTPGENNDSQNNGKIIEINKSTGSSEISPEKEIFDNNNNNDVNPKDNEEDESDDDDLENDKYPPMDESQILENAYVSDAELIKIFKSKKFHSYLKPTVHLLLNKNNSLNIINPSSTIMRQLDSTGKLFLEHYVTNLAMNQLDIGNKQFFLDYALSVASTDKAILYCLVAWGGMFLVGRNNEDANKYFKTSYKLIQNRRNSNKIEDITEDDSNKSNSKRFSITQSDYNNSFSKNDVFTNLILRTKKLSNDENIKCLLFYILLLCAEISTGDVSRWYQMLLQCKDILDNYGSLGEFIKINQNSKVAKWIISNIFYHDVLSTKTLDYGTLFSFDEYKFVFQTQKILENGDYGLDPFFGLSQDLYLLLANVANHRKTIKNMKFPLSFIPTSGLSSVPDEKYSKETIKSWFEIFDNQILNCKPPKKMLELLLNLDSTGKLLEYHLTWFELTQICLRIYIRINFKEIEFDNVEIQNLRSKAVKLFNILIGTKLQTLLGLSLLMIGVTSVTVQDRIKLKSIYEKFLCTFQIVNVQVCWEIIQQVWNKYDNEVYYGKEHYVDWPEVVNAMGWYCCFT